MQYETVKGSYAGTGPRSYGNTEEVIINAGAVDAHSYEVQL